jgi:hypothetical protein
VRSALDIQQSIAIPVLGVIVSGSKPRRRSLFRFGRASGLAS